MGTEGRKRRTSTIASAQIVCDTLTPLADRLTKSLLTRLAYAAPEVRENILWEGIPPFLPGLPELCATYESGATRDAFAALVEERSERIARGESAFSDVP